MQSQHTAQMTRDMVFTKCRKSHKYCNTLHNKCKTKLYKKGFGEIFIFVKYDPMPTLSDMRVGNNFKKFLFLQKKHCNLRLLHV